VYTGIQERAAIVAAMCDTNFSPLQVVETWTCDAGTMTEVTGPGVRLSGFPDEIPLLGEWWQFNGDYVPDGIDYIMVLEHPVYGEETNRLTFTGSVWALQSLPGWTDYVSDTLSGTEWRDFVGWPVPGAASTNFPAATNMVLAVTNITTTNALGAFSYTYEDDSGTHSGTGHAWLTTGFLAAMDAKIYEMIPYFSPTNILDPGRYSDTNFPGYGEPDVLTRFRAFRDAEVGVATNNSGYFTLQPGITNRWLLGEWGWNGTSWELTSIGDMLPTGIDWVDAAIKPAVTYHSVMTNTSWMSATITGVDATNGSRTIELGWDVPGSIPLDDQLRAVSSAVFSGAPVATGDCITVHYDITPDLFYTSGGYFLSGQFFEERAAVLGQLVCTPVTHSNAWYADDYWGIWTDRVYANTNTLTNWIQLAQAAYNGQQVEAVDSGSPTSPPESYWMFTPDLDGIGWHTNSVEVIRHYAFLRHHRKGAVPPLLPAGASGGTVLTVEQFVGALSAVSWFWDDSVCVSNWPDHFGVFPWAGDWNVRESEYYDAGPVGNADMTPVPMPPESWITDLEWDRGGSYGWDTKAAKSYMRWDVDAGLLYP
jgi:hypothetical protein